MKTNELTSIYTSFFSLVRSIIYATKTKQKLVNLYDLFAFFPLILQNQKRKKLSSNTKGLLGIQMAIVKLFDWVRLIITEYS